MRKFQPYQKAIAGFVVAGATSALAARGVNTEAGAIITSGEWVEAGLTGLITAAGVWAIPNKDPKGKHQDESVQPPETTPAGPDYFPEVH